MTGLFRRKIPIAHPATLLHRRCNPLGMLLLLRCVAVFLAMDQALSFQAVSFHYYRNYNSHRARSATKHHLPFAPNHHSHHNRWVLWTKKGNDDDQENKEDEEPVVAAATHGAITPEKEIHEKMSLSELLQQLNDRGIPFSPSATRKELEELWITRSQAHNKGALHHDELNEFLPDDDVKKNNSTVAARHEENGWTAAAASRNEYPQHVVSSSSSRKVERPKEVSRSGGSNNDNVIRIQKRRQIRQKRQTSINGDQKQASTDNDLQSPRSNQRKRSRQQRPNNDDIVNAIDGSCYSSSFRKRSYNDDFNVIDDDRILRRNRRQQRQASSKKRQNSSRTMQPVSWVKTNVANPLQDVLPDQWVDVGYKATKVARQKTGQLWKDVMDWAYDDEGEAGGYGYAARKKRRRRQDQSRSPPEDRSRDGGNDSSSTSTRRSRYVDNTSNSYTAATNNPQRARTQRKSVSPRDMATQPKSRTEFPKSPARESTVHDTPMQARSIRDILQDLSDGNIPFSPTSSRQDLEELLAKSRSSFREDTTATIDHPNYASNTQLFTSEAAGQRKGMKPTSRETIIEKSLDSTKRPEHVVDVEIVVDDDIMDAVEVEHFSPEEWQQRIREKKRQEELEAQLWKQKREEATKAASGRNPSSQNKNDESKSRRPIPMTYGSITSRMRRVPDDFTPKKRTPRRPTAARSQPNPTAVAAARTSKRRQPAKNDVAGRRVYSPYGTDFSGFVDGDDDDDLELKDGINRLGDFLADSVDSILWGPADDEDVVVNGKVRGDKRPTTRQRPATSNTESSKSQPRRHWRDKMEERVDIMLGLHKDGTTYQRWMKQEQRDAAEATGTDALSYARGRATKSRKPKGRNNPYNNRKLMDDTPFWEQDGSLISMLLGGNGGGAKNNSPLHRRRNDNGSFGHEIYQALHSSSLSLLLRTLVVFAARFFGSLCRWGSVYNTIPRPLVAFALFTAGVIVRGPFRARVMSMTFALLSLRVVGEWLDGYLTIGDDYDDDEVLGDDGNERVASNTAPEPAS